MNVSRLPFKILQCFGIWRPKSSSSQWNIWLYNFYSFCMINTLVTFMISFLFYGTTRNENSQSLISEDFFLIVDMIGIGLKILNIFIYRKDIIVFDNMFRQVICSPRNVFEFNIKHKFDNRNRWQKNFGIFFSCL